MEHLTNSILGQIQEPLPDEKINRLIDSLLGSSFLQENQLSQFSIEELGEKLFESKEEQNNSVLRGEVESSILPELEKCIHDYCLLLQELETQNVRDFGVQTLHEVRSRQTQTQYIESSLKITPSEVIVAVEPPPEPLTDPEPLRPPDDMPEIFPEPTSEGAEPPPLMPEPFGSPEWEGAKGSEAAPAVSNWMHDDGETEHLVPNDLNDGLHHEVHQEEGAKPAPQADKFSLTSEKVEESISHWVELPKSVAEPEHDHEPVTASHSGLFPPEDQDYLQAPDKKSREETGLCDEAYDFKASSEKFLGATGVTPAHQRKFSVAALCMSIERELHHRLFTAIGGAWAERAIPIVTALDTENRRFDLKPSLKKHFEKLAKQHRQWLYEEKLPFSGMINSLRYILATEELDKFRPSLLDWGVALLWFGEEKERSDVKFTNLLGLRGLDELQLVETTFLLFRVNKIKLNALSVVKAFDENQLKEATQDCHRLLELVKSIRVELDHNWPKVA